MRRGALLVAGLSLVLAGGGGAWLLRQRALRAVDDALEARGLRAGRREAGWTWAEWRGVEGPGITVERLRAELDGGGQARLQGVVVDLAALPWGDGAGAAAGGAGASGRRVEVRDLSLRYGEHRLFEGLSGTLSPALELEGEGQELRRGPEGWLARLRRPVDLGFLRGTSTLEAHCAQGCDLHLEVPDLVVEHALLAKRPLGPWSLTADLRYGRDDHSLSGELQLEGWSLTLQGRLVPDPLEVELRFEVPGRPLSELTALFGAAVPEADTAELRGTVGLSGAIQGPPWSGSLRPQMEGLAAAQIISDPGALAGGTITWRAPAGQDDWVLRSTGEGHPNWVPLSEAGLVPAAMIAAEDSGFYRHAGYDPASIQAALDQFLGGGDLRGGSTITQQLCKNLFLDGRDRSMARKLRELLYALELDRHLPKERILELYINVVELGPELFGVGQAADAYFLKRPQRLSPREAAFLAAILPAPRSLGERAWLGGPTPEARISRVLDTLGLARAIAPDALERARRERLIFVPPPR